MKYVAIDVETSGLDRSEDQILEFAAVFTVLGDNRLPTNALPTFHIYVNPGRIRGSAFALAMNAKAIENIRDGNCVRIEDLACRLYDWLHDRSDLVDWGYDNISSNIQPRATLNIAGKNYASFDDYFVKRVPHWNRYFNTGHRVGDPMNLYLRARDTSFPNLQTCLERAGIDRTVKHTAAADAYDVIDLFRKYYDATPDTETVL